MEVGDSYTFIPHAFLANEDSPMLARNSPTKVTGEIVQINRRGNWFRVRYLLEGRAQHECFPIPVEEAAGATLATKHGYRRGPRQ